MEWLYSRHLSPGHTPPPSSSDATPIPTANIDKPLGVAIIRRALTQPSHNSRQRGRGIFHHRRLVRNQSLTRRGDSSSSWGADGVVKTDLEGWSGTSATDILTRGSRGTAMVTDLGSEAAFGDRGQVGVSAATDCTTIRDGSGCWACSGRYPVREYTERLFSISTGLIRNQRESLW